MGWGAFGLRFCAHSAGIEPSGWLNTGIKPLGHAYKNHKSTHPPTHPTNPNTPQIGGRIIDSAFTVAFNPRYDPLLAAVKAATDAVSHLKSSSGGGGGTPRLDR